MSLRAVLFVALLPILACDKGSGSSAAPTPPASPPTQATAPGTKAEAGAPFGGQVVLGEGVSADEVKPGDILFIIAREPGPTPSAMGRLLAAKREADVKLPFTFSVAASDVMMPGLPFTGPFIVTARVDHDGDPLTRGEDDLYAAVDAPVLPGQADLKLVLKKGPPKDMIGVTPAGAPPGGAPPANPHGEAPPPASPHGAMPGKSPHGPMPATNNPHGDTPPAAPNAPHRP